MKTRSATRVSEGLPRRRSSYDPEAIPSSRPKKQSRRPPKKKFPLMKLPAEIRLKILRELLWQSEPLKKIGRRAWYEEFTRVEGTNYTFHPAILSTCRKLNEEGCTVLYEENTVEVMFFCYGFDYNSHRIDWMGYATDLKRVSESLSQRARKLRITIEVYCQNDLSADIARSDLRDLVQILLANSQWCSLEIHIKRNELHERFLRPFGILRRLRHVDVTGVSPQFAAELSELMKSDSQVADLPKMYDHLARHARTVLSQSSRGVNPFDDFLFDVEEAMDAGNVADFCKHRDKVLWEVEKIARENYQQIFQYDPDPVASRLSNNAFVIEQERLKNLAGNLADVGA
jgi:hypothetical protein